MSDNQFRVLCCTWNVNGRLVDSDSLAQWLCPSSSSSPQIVAIALQEVVDLHALKHYMYEEETRIRLNVWGETLLRTLQLHYRHNFSILAKEQMVGTCLIILVQSQLLPCFQHIQKGHVATGKFGVIGNKGGCAIRFTFLNSFSFCFLGMHLSAHQSQSVKRTNDWESVLHLKFTDNNNRGITLVKDSEEELDMAILEHDLIFAMGDLNYRVEYDSVQDVLDQLEKGNLNALLERDQLLLELRTSKAFEGFQDASTIRFPPTFKFQVGTTSTYNEKRIPSWCDRILVNRNPNLQAIARFTCEDYRSCSSLVVSDHKPVAADFLVELSTQLLSPLARNVHAASFSRPSYFVLDPLLQQQQPPPQQQQANKVMNPEHVFEAILLRKDASFQGLEVSHLDEPLPPPPLTEEEPGTELRKQRSLSDLALSTRKRWTTLSDSSVSGDRRNSDQVQTKQRTSSVVELE